LTTPPGGAAAVAKVKVAKVKAAARRPLHLPNSQVLAAAIAPVRDSPSAGPDLTRRPG